MLCAIKRRYRMLYVSSFLEMLLKCCLMLLTFRLAWCREYSAVSSYGDRTFAAAGPRLWNSLPVQLRNPDITYGLLK